MADRYPQAATLISSILWGSSFVAIGWGLRYLDPYSFAFLRFLFSALFLLPLLGLFSKFDYRLLGDRYIIFTGALNGIAYLLQFVGQAWTTPAKAALLVNVNVVLVAFLSSRIFGESFTLRKIYAVMLGVIGVFLITTRGDVDVFSGGDKMEFIGDVLVLLAGMIWAFYIVATKKILSEKERDIRHVTASVFIYTTIVLLPPFLFVRNFSVPPVGWIAIIYTAIFCTILAFLLWSYGLRRMSATTSSVMLLMEIVSAFILSIFLGLEEKFTVMEILGVVLIFTAVTLASLGKNSFKIS